MPRVLPFLLLLVTVLASAGGAATGLEITQRERDHAAAVRAAAEARQRAAQDAYRQALVPLVRRLADVTAAAASADGLDIISRDDVLLSKGLLPTTQTAADQLAALAVPARLTTQAADVRTALEAIGHAVVVLQDGAKAERKTERADARTDHGFEQLQAALDQWALAADAVLKAPVATYEDDVKTLRGEASFIVAVDERCSRASSALDGVHLRTRAEFLRNGDKVADSVAALISSLQKMLAGHPRTVTLRRSLAQAGDLSRGLHDELRGVRQRDYAQAIAGFHRLERGLDHWQPAADQFRVLGTTWCSYYFTTRKPAADKGVTA